MYTVSCGKMDPSPAHLTLAHSRKQQNGLACTHFVVEICDFKMDTIERINGCIYFFVLQEQNNQRLVLFN